MGIVVMKEVLLVLFLFFVLLPVVSAESFQLSIEPEKTEVHSGTFFTVDIIAKNLENKEHDLIVAVRGDRPWWWQYGQRTYLLPEAGEVRMTQGFFPVDAEKGEYNFVFEVGSFKFPDLKMNVPFTVVILPDVYLAGLEAMREADEVTATIEVDVVDDMEVDFSVDIISGDIISSHVFSQKLSKGKQKFDKSFSLLPRSDYIPGSYMLRVKFEDQMLEAGFTVEPVVMFDVETRTTTSLFSEETLTIVKNVGNVKGTFERKDSFSTGDWVTGDFVAPDVKAVGGENEITHSLPINAGETQVFSVARQIWPVYVYLGIVVLVIAVSGNMTGGRYTRPKILKRYRRRGRGMTSIVLGVKNTFSPAKKVIVRDWVSPLASVVMGEFESIKPVMRRSEAGTELIWSLGDMRPGEERLISYKIRPIIQGNLKLSRASLRYNVRSGESRRVYSNTVSIS